MHLPIVLACDRIAYLMSCKETVCFMFSISIVTPVAAFVSVKFPLCPSHAKSRGFKILKFLDGDSEDLAPLMTFDCACVVIHVSVQTALLCKWLSYIEFLSVGCPRSSLSIMSHFAIAAWPAERYFHKFPQQAVRRDSPWLRVCLVTNGMTHADQYGEQRC